MSIPVSTTFVGRGGDLTALVEAAATTRVQAVLVTGEAGIGKSRLVAEFTARLAPETAVLIGRCPEFGGGGVPFAPFVAALRRLIRLRGPEELAALLPGANPALARWLPELRTGTVEADVEFDRLRLFGELLTLLERLAVERPAVLILEDLHWADDSSRELFAFLVANLAEPNALLVATFRPSGPPALRRLVAELRRNPAVRFIAPEPLTRHEVGRQLAALLGREPEPESIGRIFARSGGNPLFVEALSRSPEQTPAELSELLLSAQSELGADARTVLRVAAVAGSPVEHDLLEAAAELPMSRLHAAVRELVDQHLLTATDTGYAFRHVLIRQAVYQDLLPIERIRRHAALSRLLRARPSLLPTERLHADLARHAFAAGECSLALTASLEAARIAERACAHGERLRHLERVVELWETTASDGTPVDRLAVLEQIVDACFHSAAAHRGIEAADQALALVDAAAAERAARLHYQRAYLRNQGGEDGYEDLQRALDLLPAQPPTLLRGRVFAELAAIASFTGDRAAAERHALNALAVAQSLGASALAAKAHAYLGLAEMDSAAAIQHFARAHDAATAADDAETVLSVLTWETAALVAAGDYTTAIDTIRTGLRTAHDTFRFAERGPILLVKWAQALTALGRWPEATQLIRETLAEPLPPLSTAALHLCHARIALARGRIEDATIEAERAERILGAGIRVGQYRLELGWVGASLALAQADPELAARRLTESLTVGELDRHPGEAWALLALGVRLPQPPPVLATLAAALPWTSPVAAAHRAVYTATISSDALDWQAAVTAWQTIAQPYEQAQTLLACAIAELGAGDRAAARTALRSAATRATAIGADPLVEKIRRTADRARLRLDSTPPGRSGGAPKPVTFGLTPRELEVLRLVAQGSSNRQLAAELFISANTAGVHVSRILDKLGVSTRTEAAAFAHQHRLLEHHLLEHRLLEHRLLADPN
ncbi:AAA family ATPase [Nocardia sp. NPDC005366]|uniref:helix-turn-helix transcriptional regulator n=1 Tax=Nocardia sp. NPDC005366 TaxID=3156878 RepID=UPI0033AC9A6C